MIPELISLKQPIAIRPEFVARGNTSFRVLQHGKGAASTKFTIFSPERDATKDEKIFPPEKNPSSAVLLHVDGKYSSPEERRTVFDTSGLPLFDLYHNPRGLTWHIEVPGGNSPSLAFIEPQGAAMKDDYKLQFRNAAAADSQDVVLRVQGQDIWKLRTNVTLDGQVIMTTKRLDMMSVYMPGSKVEWQVDVADGMDMALAAAIVVVMGANMYTNGRSRGRVYIGPK